MDLFGRWYVDPYVFRRTMLALGGLVIAVALGLSLLTGKDPVTALANPNTAPDCRAYAVDVGTSTARGGDTSLRGKYLNYMHDELQGAAADKAQLYVGYFAGQPPQEFEAYRFNATDSNRFDAGVEGAELIGAAQSTLTQELTQPSELTDGSTVISTVGAMARETPPGCDLTVVSDGIENSGLGSFGVGGSTPLLAPGAVDALLARVSRKGVVPDLTGRRFAMPFLTKSSGVGPDRIYNPDRRRAATRAFWEGFARAAHTRLQAPNQ
jgi:hypothetical protein